MATELWNPDELRTKFSLALSEMYRQEVPLYGDLVQIVREVNKSVLEMEGKSLHDLPTRHQIERHGAIRLGSDYELSVIKRLFALFGMQPVGYYDLGIVGFPLHATAFRPISEESLEINPFRVFTSVLRKDQVSPSIRPMMEAIMQQRELFTPLLLDIICRAEAGNSMSTEDVGSLIIESLKIFKWHSKSTVSIEDYLKLKEEHMMIADIVCFPSAHINHLTPRTLDIDLIQTDMVKNGMPAKDRIEGPPRRQCPILLRQTSFKALEEKVIFSSAGTESVPGTHTARFGEVEQRGAAVTHKGRALYDRLLELATQQALIKFGDSSRLDDCLAEVFLDYPDSWAELQEHGLVYFRYQVTPGGLLSAIEGYMDKGPRRVPLSELISRGLVDYEPITYEDFLPLSAAGIFRSNLKEGPALTPINEKVNGLVDLEKAMACKVLNEFGLYSQLQEESLLKCAKGLRLDEILIS